MGNNKTSRYGPIWDKLKAEKPGDKTIVRMENNSTHIRALVRMVSKRKNLDLEWKENNPHKQIEYTVTPLEGTLLADIHLFFIERISLKGITHALG